VVDHARARWCSGTANTARRAVEMIARHPPRSAKRLMNALLGDDNSRRSSFLPGCMRGGSGVEGGWDPVLTARPSRCRSVRTRHLGTRSLARRSVNGRRQPGMICNERSAVVERTEAVIFLLDCGQTPCLGQRTRFGGSRRPAGNRRYGAWPVRATGRSREPRLREQLGLADYLTPAGVSIRPRRKIRDLLACGVYAEDPFAQGCSAPLAACWSLETLWAVRWCMSAAKSLSNRANYNAPEYGSGPRPRVHDSLHRNAC